MLEDIVIKILSRQRMMFGEKFQKQWNGISTDELVGFWASELKGYSEQELARGTEALRKLSYPPTLPEFLKLCRPPIDASKAYYEAVKGVQDRTNGKKGEWSHPAIFWATVGMAHDLLNRPYSAIEKQWKAQLDKELEKTEWDDIPEVPLMLNREIKKTDRNVALEAMAKIRDVVNKKPATSWIKRNLERIAKGEITNPTVIWCTKNAYKEIYGKAVDA